MMHGGKNVRVAETRGAGTLGNHSLFLENAEVTSSRSQRLRASQWFGMTGFCWLNFFQNASNTVVYNYVQAAPRRKLYAGSTAYERGLVLYTLPGFTHAAGYIPACNPYHVLSKNWFYYIHDLTIAVREIRRWSAFISGS